MDANQTFLLEIVDKLWDIHVNTTDGDTAVEIEALRDFILQAVEIE